MKLFKGELRMEIFLVLGMAWIILCIIGNRVNIVKLKNTQNFDYIFGHFVGGICEIAFLIYLVVQTMQTLY